MTIKNFSCKLLTVLFFTGVFLVGGKIMAQNDTIYYDSKWKTTVKDSAVFFRPPVKKEGNLYVMQDFYSSGKLQMSGTSSKANKDFWEGKVTWYNEDGSILQQGNYTNNRLNGTYISTLDGKSLKALFKDGRIVSGKTNSNFGNNRRYYTEIKGDTTLNIIYEKDIKGVRYERYCVGNRYDVLIKYFDVDGKFIGERKSLSNGTYEGLEVSYYKEPMRPLRITYYPKGQKLGATVYYCNDQVREEFNSTNGLSKTFYSPAGKVIGKINYVYENNYLKPVDGKEYQFYSSYNEYKEELIKGIRTYSEGKLVTEQEFYENQQLKSRTEYTDGAKELQISYGEDGKEIARMVYKNWTPLNGTEIIGDRKATYKDGKLVVELNNYYNTDIVFSEKTTDKETYYDKNGTILGTLNLEDDNGYLKAISGDRYTIDYEGDVSAIEHYEKGFVTRRTSYRKRKISEKENAAFKTVELYEPLGYKRTKEIRFYSNGKKQSKIAYEGYDKTTGTFYDMDENVLGAYNFKTKEGTVYEFFGDSDQVKLMETRKDGEQLRLKRYDYGPNNTYGQIDPVLVEDIDANCCASFYSREGELLGKITFKEGKPWEGTYYDVKKRTSYILKQGKRNGAYKKYDYDESILEEGTFKDDKEEGLFKYYSYNEELVKTENFNNGLLNGIARYYDEDQKLAYEMTYKAGLPLEGTRLVNTYSSKKPITETFIGGVMVKRISYDDNGKRVSSYAEGKEKETTAYYGDTDKKRLSYKVDGSTLDGRVISYDKDGKEQYSALFEKGKLKEGTVMLTGGNVRGNPEYMVLSREPDTLTVKLMGQNNKVLFAAKENLAFGTATVFMQNLDIYMDYIGPNRLY